jgi:hypothetical protein
VRGNSKEEAKERGSVKEISMSQLGIDSVSEQQVNIVAAAPSDQEVGCCIGNFMPKSALGGMKTDVEVGT